MTIKFQPLLATAALALALSFGAAGSAAAADGLSLLTDTPEEGFELAVKLSQKGVGTVQPDVDVRKGLRDTYSHDPKALIAVSQVIATNFQTVAAANNYWAK